LHDCLTWLKVESSSARKKKPVSSILNTFLDHIQSKEFLKMISIVQCAQGQHFQILHWSYTIRHCYVVSIFAATFPKLRSHHLQLPVC
jgi:hypothetical protein